MDTVRNISAAPIRELREAKDLTQLQAAELCHLELGTYQRAENPNASSPPGLKILRAIAAGYNINVGVLLGDTRPTIIEKEHSLEECAKRLLRFVATGQQPARDLSHGVDFSKYEKEFLEDLKATLDYDFEFMRDSIIAKAKPTKKDKKGEVEFISRDLPGEIERKKRALK